MWSVVRADGRSEVEVLLVAGEKSSVVVGPSSLGAGVHIGVETLKMRAEQSAKGTKMSCPAYYQFLGNLIEENDPQAHELVGLYIQLGRGTVAEEVLEEIRETFSREDLPGEIRRRKAEVAA